MKKVIIFLIFIIAIIAGVIVGMNFKNSNKETGKDQIKSENKVNVTSEITENATTENTTSKEEATVQNNNKEEGIDVNSFKGVWHYPDSVYPDDELIIKNIDGNKITFDIEKELGVEIVGETKMKIAIEDDEEPWDDLDIEMNDEIAKEIDENVKEDFI